MPTFYAGQPDYIAKLNELDGKATVSLVGTISSSLSLTTGTKSFVTDTLLQLHPTSRVNITRTSDVTKYMSGVVLTYDQDTGNMSVDVQTVSGSGTFSDWTITLTGSTGVADNLSIGTVTSGAAAASITGTSPNKLLNLTLQTGATGAKGVNPRGNWSAGTAYVVDDLAYEAGSTWRRKVAGTTATAPSSDLTNWEIFAQKGEDNIVADYIGLRAYIGTSTALRVSGYTPSGTPLGINGLFTVDISDTSSSDNGGTIIVASNGKRWKRVFDGALNVLWFGATTGTDISSSLQSAINSIPSGGQIYIPSGNYDISATMSIVKSGILIRGDGCGTSHDVGSATGTSSTIIRWTGVAGGTMFSFSSTSGAGNQKMSGGGLNGVMLNANGAGIGIEVKSWNAADFNSIYLYEFSVSGINCDVVSTLGEAPDSQGNKFSQITSRQFTTSGTGITLNGSSSANTSLNLFENISLKFNNGNGLDVVNADNNTFTRLSCYSGGGTGKPLIFRGSNSSAGETARANLFINYSANATGLAEGTTSKTYPSTNNKFIFSDTDNSTPIPTRETGATLWWSDQNNVDLSTALVLPTIASTSADAISTRTSRGSEALTVYDGSENHVVLSDGTRKWSMSVLSTGKMRIIQTAGSGNFSIQAPTEITGTAYFGGVQNAESLRVVSVASCVNRFHMTGTVSGGNSVILSVAGTDTNIGTFLYNKGIGGWSFTNPSQQRYFSISTNGLSAPVNYVEVVASATTFAPKISAVGTDSNINLEFTPKGTGNCIITTGNLSVFSAGSGLRVKEGSNAKQGVTSAMVAGSVTVSNSSVTASSRIFFSRNTAGGTLGHLSYTKTAGTSFTITSTSNTETSSFDYQIFEPA